MPNLYKDVVAANELYAQTYTAQPDAFAHRHAAILTCMDSRLLPNEFMGFKAGDIHLIRNAGGRASDDAIRSLIISSKLLKTNQFFVVHHTDCGMQRFTNESVQEVLASALASSVTYQPIDWLTIQHGLFKSVLEDVTKIRNHPLISSDIPIYGFIFDVMTGKLIPVDEAIRVGKAK